MVLGGMLLLVMAGCTYEAAVRSLPVAERSEFRAYRKMMTPSQVQTYLAKTTPAERQAYLRDIGLAQRFEALDEHDRSAVLAGQIRLDVSAEALCFIWGEPSYWEGFRSSSAATPLACPRTPPGPYSGEERRNSYARWFYRGSSFSLASTGNQSRELGSQVVVELVDGRVTGWNDFIPSTNDDKSEPLREK
jgi:hypothetical protein